jgi:D-sedoheptulose 7-phosphate isomerase
VKPVGERIAPGAPAGTGHRVPSQPRRPVHARPAAGPSPPGLAAHLDASVAAIRRLEAHLERLDRWADHLAARLTAGGRVLVAGNGGSAALAQHLTAELVGRYRDDRPAFSALALHAETSSLTAIANDYGFACSYARQVEAHGRPGDVLVLLSTSGRSPNLLAAADAARARGLRCLAMTGPAPNPLAERSDDAVALDVASSAAIQEAHQVAVHLLCAAFDRRTVTP